uniref:Uncharacterized protein n=1 Tax=Rhizophora mucronata TaxID=61149 RepID=A0A2P2Q5X5_RHIMU
MEGSETESRSGGSPKSQIAVRCAKAAILLSSLKSSPYGCLKSVTDDQDELKEKQKLVREIEDLQKEVAWERIKSKQMRLHCSIDVILQVMVVLTVSTFLLVLSFMSR